MPHAVARRWPAFSTAELVIGVTTITTSGYLATSNEQVVGKEEHPIGGTGQDPVHAISEGHDQTSRVKGSKDTLSRYTWGGASLHCTDRASPRQQMHWYQKAGYLDGQGTTGVFGL
ncbi:hypothetical protein OsJ_24668 [Oryza sativa Japonica Group]|uniref:Uncharacterized protein n=1 Tax=Oryza sativa subsp. japonica TaxID=39947 RepID=A3BKY4_ORYSJ|nr:hypothetical protein OsJ_24668 [Oryza sativa Japonica Group]